MHDGRCHWSRALCQVSGRACSCKKDPCCRAPYFFVGKNSAINLHFHFHLHLKWVGFPRDFRQRKFTRSSSETPNKAINAANQFCLVCDCVVVSFNVCSCPGLQRVIGRAVKRKESHRMSRKWKQKIDSAIKKVQAADRVFN